jgi:hypothetical protein
MEPVDIARELVLDRFPAAEWALLTGSVVGPHRTAGSDLDIVVLDETDPGHRESLRYRDWPGPLSPDQRDWLRYGLTDGLDDLRHATDPGERAVIATGLWIGSAEAVLSLAGRWVSGGKWLLRELREHDAEFAERWLAARDDPAALVTEVLESAGGPLFDGYRA